MNELSPEIVRRLKFVLSVARNEQKSSQDLKTVMRVLSNIASVGRDGSSGLIYRLNRLVSAKALNKLEACDDFDCWIGNEKKGFKRQVINEHQMPLEAMVRRIRSSEEMNFDSVWSLLSSHPMVTILISEDAELRKVAKREVDPSKRYTLAGIEVVNLPVGPYEYWTKRHSKTQA